MPPEAREEHKHASINTFAQALLSFAFSVKTKAVGDTQKESIFFSLCKNILHVFKKGK